MKRTMVTFVAFATMAVGALAEEIQPTLIGGTAADPKDWPASVYASMGNSRCSATVVGERTLLIAAHCVSNGGTASFSVLSNRYSARCTHHQSYRSNSTADYALCLINTKVLGVPYERIEVAAAPLKVNDTVRLTGYGCIRAGGTGGNDGIFRTGNARVTRLPSGTNYDTVTVGGGALCYGDSGGAAYIERNGSRSIFGVNSRGDIRTTSYLSSTYVNTFKSYAASWSSSNAQKICGLDAQAAGCRGGGGPNPLPNEFVLENGIARVQANLKPGFEQFFDELKAGIDDLLASLE